jgi:hypothetical protein
MLMGVWRLCGRGRSTLGTLDRVEVVIVPVTTPNTPVSLLTLRAWIFAGASSLTFLVAALLVPALLLRAASAEETATPSGRVVIEELVGAAEHCVQLLGEPPGLVFLERGAAVGEDDVIVVRCGSVRVRDERGVVYVVEPLGSQAGRLRVAGPGKPAVQEGGRVIYDLWGTAGSWFKAHIGEREKRVALDVSGTTFEVSIRPDGFDVVVLKGHVTIRDVEQGNQRFLAAGTKYTGVGLDGVQTAVEPTVAQRVAAALERPREIAASMEHHSAPTVGGNDPTRIGASRFDTAGPRKKRLVVLGVLDQGSLLTTRDLAVLDEALRLGVASVDSDYSILDRETIAHWMSPGRLEATRDCGSERCVIEVGRILGADAVVAGTVTKARDEYWVRLVMIDAATGEIVGKDLVHGQDLCRVADELADRSVRIVGGDRRERGYAACDGSPIRSYGNSSIPMSAEPPHNASKQLVSFESRPSGAQVLIDGEPVCMTPCVVDRPTGRSHVAIRKDHYLTWTTVVDVRDFAASVIASLSPYAGSLRVTSEPNGQPVSLDGRPVGFTPSEISNVESGMHSVDVGDNRHVHERVEVSLGSGERAIHVKLRPRYGAGLKQVPAGVVHLPGQSTSVRVEAFAIADRAVTVGEYAVFEKAERHSSTPPRPSCGENEAGRADFPVTCVDASLAAAFCAWAGQRLPTAAEWIRARYPERDFVGPDLYPRRCSAPEWVRGARDGAPAICGVPDEYFSCSCRAPGERLSGPPGATFRCVTPTR